MFIHYGNPIKELLIVSEWPSVNWSRDMNLLLIDLLSIFWALLTFFSYIYYISKIHPNIETRDQNLSWIKISSLVGKYMSLNWSTNVFTLKVYRVYFNICMYPKTYQEYQEFAGYLGIKMLRPRLVLRVEPWPKRRLLIAEQSHQRYSID